MDITTSSEAGEAGRRGLWFDAAVLAGNIFLLGPITDLAKRPGDTNPLFGALLIVAAFLFAVGAGFKRRPLQVRLAARNRPAMGTAALIFFFVLMVMHLGLFMLCAMVGAELIHGAPAGQLTPGPWRVAETVGLVVLALAPTVMTVGAMLKPRALPESLTALRGREAAADVLLYASCMITLAWWNGSLAELFAGVDAALPMRVLLVVLITVPFSIFYLAPRVLFLFEDYRCPRTWLGVLLAMLPLAIRVVIR